MVYSYPNHIQILQSAFKLDHRWPESDLVLCREGWPAGQDTFRTTEGSQLDILGPRRRMTHPRRIWMADGWALIPVLVASALAASCMTALPATPTPSVKQYLPRSTSLRFFPMLILRSTIRLVLKG